MNLHLRHTKTAACTCDIISNAPVITIFRVTCELKYVQPPDHCLNKHMIRDFKFVIHEQPT